MTDTLNIRDNAEQSRFEMIVEGHLAEVAYRRETGQIVFIHTRVPEELSGRGIAGQLARFVLDAARAEGLKVVPQCPYIAGYIQKHPEYQDLVV